MKGQCALSKAMLRCFDKTAWRRRLRSTVLAVAVAASACGCQTARYYAQAVRGQSQILKERKPIADLIADPDTSPKLKAKFELILRLRTFAQSDLKLPINRHYLTYVDLNRRFAVWNVHAAPEFSLEPKRWWYPFVGSLKYRGFFAEADARQCAARLEANGDDVYVEGVEAYSTLGWFADPLMNTFIYHSEPALAETLFHELAHQRLFFGGDTDFNEAFATAVADEGVRRWFQAANDEPAYHRYLAESQRNKQFVSLVLETRELLQALYGETTGFFHRPTQGSGAPWLREEKAKLINQFRQNYQKLKESWGGRADYDGWFAQSLNNAQLNTIAVYYELVPGFQALLEQQGGDLEAFYREVHKMHRLTTIERRQRLRRLSASARTPAQPNRVPGVTDFGHAALVP
jgi:predicted aminopeptidase